MSEFKAVRPKDEKKVSLKCSICGAKVQLTPEEVKASKNYDTYIIRHEYADVGAAVQAGTLCDVCLEKPMDKRVITRHK